MDTGLIEVSEGACKIRNRVYRMNFPFWFHCRHLFAFNYSVKVAGATMACMAMTLLVAVGHCVFVLLLTRSAQD